jgi:hypothetical protein
MLASLRVAGKVWHQADQGSREAEKIEVQITMMLRDL